MQARRSASGLAIRLVAYLLNLASERLVFPHPGLQEPHGDPGLLLNSTGREQIHVRRLVPAVLEVRCLDPASIDQAFQAVIDLAQTESQFLGDLPLAQSRIGLEQFQQPVTNFFGKHGWCSDWRV